MEIIAKKVLVWGKVISFLQGGEPGFSVRGDVCCNMGGQGTPAWVSGGEEVLCLSARGA